MSQRKELPVTTSNALIISGGIDLTTRKFDIEHVELVNEFTSVQMDVKMFFINMQNGKLSFKSPYGYFHEFINKTIMESVADRCMEEASYNLYVYFKHLGERYRFVFVDPVLLSCNNYGREEGHEILMQAKKKFKLEKMEKNERQEEQARDVRSFEVREDIQVLETNYSIGSDSSGEGGCEEPLLPDRM